MKNPLKSCHLFCWVHRGFGIQNNQLDLRINEFLTVLKTLHGSQRYLQFFDLSLYLFCKYLQLQCIVSKTVKNSLILRSSWLFWIPKPLWTQQNRWQLFHFSFIFLRKSMKILLTNGLMLRVPLVPSFLFFHLKVQRTCSSDCPA